MLANLNLYLGKQEELIKKMVANKNKTMFLAINTDCYNIACNNPEYLNILSDDSAIVYVDGMGIILGQRFLNEEVATERIATTDLFPALFKYLEKNKIYDKKIFLVGGKPGTSEKVKKNFKQNYPNINIVDTHDGYNFDYENSTDLIEYINSTEADFIFVGLGCPRQEKWVYNNFEQLNVNNIITCGGLFDYYAENVKRAPKWMQKYSLEWLFRFIQEPTRLFKRYFFGNTIFILRLLNLKIKRKGL